MRLPNLSTQGYPVTKWILPAMGLFGAAATAARLSAEQPIIENYMSDTQMFGTLLMMTLLPGYLMSVMIFIQRQSISALETIKPATEPHAWQTAHYYSHHLAKYALPIIALGAVYGLWQNRWVIENQWQHGNGEFLDLFFVVSNAFLWSTIALTTCWRLPAAWALGQVGRSLRVDLYDLHAPRALANLATKDVLIVTGGMAFMPLQSLDAEFRWVNYQSGLLVGIPTAAILLLAPLLGLRANIAQAKAARESQLRALLADTKRTEVGELEIISAHIERIKNTSNWGLDLGLLTKVFAYLVIPPLAWVGAALVENLVEQLY